MKNNSNIFDRILAITDYYGLDGIPALSEKLGYKSPEKLYRLSRSEAAKPSFDMIKDFGAAFKSLNLRYLIAGEGQIENSYTNEFEKAAEPTTEYGNKYDQIFKLMAEGIIEAIHPKLKEYDAKIQEVHDRISLKEEMEALRSEIQTGKSKVKN